MILIIDNYDSFTYNLVQLIGRHRSDMQVVRNDKITISEITTMKPEGIVISPGPGRPEDAGICIECIRNLGGSIPMLGVCLGHQAIGHAFGGKIVHAPRLMHGKTSPIRHSASGIFSGVANPFTATRYHSLVIDPASLPDVLEVTAETDDGVIMGVRHKQFPIEGVQFHPESILTVEGERLMENWLRSITYLPPAQSAERDRLPAQKSGGSPLLVKGV